MKKDPADLVRQLHAAGDADALIQAGPRWWFGFRGKDVVVYTRPPDAVGMNPVAWAHVPYREWRQYTPTMRRLLCAIALRQARRVIRTKTGG